MSDSLIHQGTNNPEKHTVIKMALKMIVVLLCVLVYPIILIVSLSNINTNIVTMNDNNILIGHNTLSVRPDQCFNGNVDSIKYGTIEAGQKTCFVNFNYLAGGDTGQILCQVSIGTKQDNKVVAENDCTGEQLTTKDGTMVFIGYSRSVVCVSINSISNPTWSRDIIFEGDGFCHNSDDGSLSIGCY